MIDVCAAGCGSDVLIGKTVSGVVQPCWVAILSMWTGCRMRYVEVSTHHAAMVMVSQTQGGARRHHCPRAGLPQPGLRSHRWGACALEAR